MQTQQPYSDAEQNNPNQERLEGESWLKSISTLEWLICNTTNPATRKIFIFAAWHQAPKHYLSKLTIWWHWSTDSSAPLNFFFLFCMWCLTSGTMCSCAMRWCCPTVKSAASKHEEVTSGCKKTPVRLGACFTKIHWKIPNHPSEICKLILNKTTVFQQSTRLKVWERP